MLGKYAHLMQSLSGLREAGINPFTVTFDEILSPTLARLNGQTVVLLGTNNYLDLTFDES